MHRCYSVPQSYSTTHRARANVQSPARTRLLRVHFQRGQTAWAPNCFDRHLKGLYFGIALPVRLSALLQTNPPAATRNTPRPQRHSDRDSLRTPQNRHIGPQETFAPEPAFSAAPCVGGGRAGNGCSLAARRTPLAAVAEAGRRRRGIYDGPGADHD